ncbi:MAG: helix-turn-helix transcriptional regulator [Caulobacteraceae bacterium]|nr:helix-turn-helix transcriptional regulator [Caulobacteraceae bacterium]
MHTGRALLAWNLRRLRVARGLSQESLAAEAGVDRVYVSELERRQANPTLDLVDKLAVALGASTIELFGRIDEGAEPLRGLKTGPRPGSRR